MGKPSAFLSVAFMAVCGGAFLPACGGSAARPFGGDVGGATSGTGGAGTAGQGGNAGTGGQVGAGSGGRTAGTGGRRAGTGGAPGIGGAPGTGGASGTGGTSASGGAPGSGGASGTGGASGGCAQWEHDYQTALDKAKQCTVGDSSACQQQAETIWSCGCKTWVNDASQLNDAIAKLKAGNCQVACPAIACVISISGVCSPITTTGGSPTDGRCQSS